VSKLATLRTAKSGLPYPGSLRLILLAHFNYSLVFPSTIPSKSL
jgi:hypothetical protein